jgi:amino acid permease
VLAFAVFVVEFTASTFVNSYSGLVLCLLLILGWKILKRAKFVGFKTTDIMDNVVTETAALDKEEEEYRRSGLGLGWRERVRSSRAWV